MNEKQRSHAVAFGQKMIDTHIEAFHLRNGHVITTPDSGNALLSSIMYLMMEKSGITSLTVKKYGDMVAELWIEYDDGIDVVVLYDRS